MNKVEKAKKKVNSFLYDHIPLKITVEYGAAFFVSVLSALIFAFGVVCFLRPGDDIRDFASGGSSGLAQNIALILELFGVNVADNHNLIFSLCYLAINIPLFFLAFFGIGKRFTIFTIVNVGSVFIFSNVLKGDFFTDIATFVNSNGGLVARALFAGLTTGLSSALAFKFDTSAGGFDVVAYYLSLRKGKNAGPYGTMINGFLIVSFYILTGIKGEPYLFYDSTGKIIASYSSWIFAITGTLFSLIYLVETMLIIDLINVRNKKVQLQIITENNDLPRLLLANVPHGVTTIKGKGAYSGNDRLIIYLVISTTELKSVLRFIREIDPTSFVNVISLVQVYGRFYMKPVK